MILYTQGVFISWCLLPSWWLIKINSIHKWRAYKHKGSSLKKSKVFTTVVAPSHNRVQTISPLPLVVIHKHHLGFRSLISVHFERCQLSSLWACVFKIVSWRHRDHLAPLSGVLNNAVHFVAVMSWSFFRLSIPFRISKHNLFSFFFLVNHLPCHSMNFREIYHLFSISKMRNRPFSAFFVPLWIHNDCFKLILTHQVTYDCLKLFYLFLLITNCI